MSLASYLTDTLEKMAAQWSRSLHTLPSSELDAQIAALEAQDRSHEPSPPDFVLALLNGEKARRSCHKGTQ